LPNSLTHSEYNESVDVENLTNAKISLKKMTLNLWNTELIIIYFSFSPIFSIFRSLILKFKFNALIMIIPIIWSARDADYCSHFAYSKWWLICEATAETHLTFNLLHAHHLNRLSKPKLQLISFDNYANQIVNIVLQLNYIQTSFST